MFTLFFSDDPKSQPYVTILCLYSSQ